MGDGVEQPLRVALMARAAACAGFRAVLRSAGMQVVSEGEPREPLPQNWKNAEVLLVDLSDRDVQSWIQALLETAPVPVLLNHGGPRASDAWSRGLLARLQGLSGRAPPVERQRTDLSRPELRVVEGHGRGAGPPRQVVVLCASVGGPKAVARFLQKLPGELPVVFLLAQHIAVQFQNILAVQLDRIGSWRVTPLGREHGLEGGSVCVLPADSRISIQTNGLVRRLDEAWASIQKPDINEVLSAAAEAYGAGCGAIIFSGLGGDGAKGCERVIDRGGFVWTQSAESCTIPNLPALAPRYAKVEFSGAPEELARELAARCRAEVCRHA